jgi:hypothetical protein
MEFKADKELYTAGKIKLYLFTITEHDTLRKYDKTKMPDGLNQRFSAFGTELADSYFSDIQRHERGILWENPLQWHQKIIRYFHKSYGNIPFDPSTLKIDLGEKVLMFAKYFIYKNLPDKEKKLLMDTIMAVSVWTEPVTLEPRDVYKCI